MKGWVYITSNEALPGLLKIGFSSKDPKVRASELDLAGLPHPHVIEYEVLVEDPQSIEKQVHQCMANYHHRKEFFRCELAIAVKTIREVVGGGAILEELRQPLPGSDGPPPRSKSVAGDLKLTYYPGEHHTVWERADGAKGWFKGKLSLEEVKWRIRTRGIDTKVRD